jgi:uncharacterized protein (TIGR03435 family)
LAAALAERLGRAVVDKTGLQGLYDLKLKLAADDSGHSIFTAIQEQMGLRLESARGPVEVLVIDSVQRQSEN